MKFRLILISGVLILSLGMSFNAQEQDQSFREISLVVNIEVPVRVFEGGKFVENLILDDFEVFENGVQQAVQAVYRVNKDMIQKREEKTKFQPQTKRVFILFFEVADYDPRLGDAIDHFMNNIITAVDDLIVVTPTKTYAMEEDELLRRSREDMAADLKSFIRADAIAGNSESRSAKDDIVRVARELREVLEGENPEPFQGLEPLISTYTAAIDKLAFIREVDQLKLLDFANYLKSRPEQKYIYLFYEKEFLPRVENRLWTEVASLYQNTDGLGLENSIAEYHDYSNQETTVDVEPVRQAYADASASIHFLFISKTREIIPGVDMVERDNDVFSVFAEMSQASGGFVESSNRPDYLFQRALEESENYYLVYYSPKHYLADGQFKKIKIKIKGKEYKVVHRAGYFAN